MTCEIHLMPKLIETVVIKINERILFSASEPLNNALKIEDFALQQIPPPFEHPRPVGSTTSSTKDM